MVLSRWNGLCRWIGRRAQNVQIARFQVEAWWPLLGDDVVLARLWDALANPIRLAILRELESPKALSAIRVAPAQGRAGGRVLARQSVKEHLDRLLAAGLVVALRRDGRPTRYVVNRPQVFLAGEALHDFARLRPGLDLEAPTAQLRPAAGSSRASAFVLVKGVGEGTCYDVEAPAQGEATWRIGRRREADICLDYDPFASATHAEVQWRDGRHWLTDLPRNRNGTTLNFRPLAKGQPVALAMGDLIGIGRTLLLYRGPAGEDAPAPGMLAGFAAPSAWRGRQPVRT